MTQLLHQSAFPHDLDPKFASKKVPVSDGGSVRITINTDLGLNPSSGVNNQNTFVVVYTGPSAISTLVFNPEGTDLTAGNTTGGNNGLDLANTYFSNVYPGLVWERIDQGTHDG